MKRTVIFNDEQKNNSVHHEVKAQVHAASGADSATGSAGIGNGFKPAIGSPGSFFMSGGTVEAVGGKQTLDGTIFSLPTQWVCCVQP